MSFDAILTARLESANDAQKRARIAIFICTIASGTILAGLWNLYGSWDAHWVMGDRSSLWAQEQLQIQQIRAWVDNNTVGIPLVGLKLTTSDAAVTGTMLLLALSIYLFLSAKRENEEICAVLVDTKHLHDQTRTCVLQRIAPLMLYAIGDRPRDTLEQTTPAAVPAKGPTDVPIRILMYLPGLTGLAILTSDAYFACCYVRPWERGQLPGVWPLLSEPERWQLGLMDASGLLLTIATLYFCSRAAICRGATRKVIAAYDALRGSDVAVV